jgi:hypothetical protein
MLDNEGSYAHSGTACAISRSVLDGQYAAACAP